MSRRNYDGLNTTLVQQLKNKIEELKQEKERFSELFEQSNDAIFLHDFNGKIFGVNKKTEDLTKYPEKELLKMKIQQLSLKSDQEKVKANFRELFKKGELIFETKIMAKNKEIKDAEISAKIVKQKNISFIQGIARDITERKKAEELLRKEKDKAQNYLNITGVMILVINADRKVALVNKKGCEILGYKEEEIIGKDWFDNFIPKRLRKQIKNVFKKLMMGKVKSVEYYKNPILTKKGERTILWHNILLKNEEGKIIGTLSSAEDITDKRKAEQQIKEISELNKEIIEKLPIGVYTVNKKGIIDYVNPAMARISGVNRNKFLQVRPFKLPTYREIGLAKKIKDIFESRPFSFGPVVYESYYAKKKTIRKFIGIPIKEEGNVVKALVVVEDLTKLRKSSK